FLLYHISMCKRKNSKPEKGAILVDASITNAVFIFYNAGPYFDESESTNIRQYFICIQIGMDIFYFIEESVCFFSVCTLDQLLSSKIKLQMNGLLTRRFLQKYGIFQIFRVRDGRIIFLTRRKRQNLGFTNHDSLFNKRRSAGNEEGKKPK